MNFFTPLTPAGVAQIYRHFTGCEPTREQAAWLLANANDPWPTNGVFLFSQPWFEDRATILVYACCHGWQLLHYWMYQDGSYLRRSFNFVLAQNYRIMGDAHYQGLPSGKPRADGVAEPLPHVYGPLFRTIVAKAAWAIWHPAYAGTYFDPRRIFSDWRIEQHQRQVSFHSPSFAAFWPVCPFGDSHIRWYLERKIYTPAELKQALKDGVLECNFRLRFDQALERLRAKDKGVNVGIARFFEQHWQTHRMFLTFNHPSYNLMAYQAERVKSAIKRGNPHEPVPDLTPEQESFVLSLPDNGTNMASVYPDHAHAWRGLDLRYPRNYRLEEAQAFYEKQIDDVEADLLRNPVKDFTGQNNEVTDNDCPAVVEATPSESCSPTESDLAKEDALPEPSVADPFPEVQRGGDSDEKENSNSPTTEAGACLS